MGILEILWIVIGILIIIGTTFYTGYKNEDPIFIGLAAVISLGLPFVIFGVTLVFPFVCIYYLGKYIGSQLGRHYGRS